jgi:hypothetical protein
MDGFFTHSSLARLLAKGRRLQRKLHKERTLRKKDLITN